MNRSSRHGLPALALFSAIFLALYAAPWPSLAAPPTGAQSTAAPASAAPTDPRAEVPPLRHASALDRYRRLTAEPPADWRAAHQTVARIGGWRAYLREAHAPEPAASAPTPPPARHRSHGGGAR